MYLMCPQCHYGYKEYRLIGNDIQHVEIDPDRSTCDCELTDDEMQELLIAAQQGSAEYEP